MRVTYEEMIVGRKYRAALTPDCLLTKGEIRIKKEDGDITDGDGKPVMSRRPHISWASMYSTQLFEPVSLVVKIDETGKVLECPEGVTVEVVKSHMYEQLKMGDSFTLKYNQPGSYIFTKLSKNHGYIDQFYNWYSDLQLSTRVILHDKPKASK
jgi:hypothetical protein